MTTKQIRSQRISTTKQKKKTSKTQQYYVSNFLTDLNKYKYVKKLCMFEFYTMALRRY